MRSKSAVSKRLPAQKLSRSLARARVLSLSLSFSLSHTHSTYTCTDSHLYGLDWASSHNEQSRRQANMCIYFGNNRHIMMHRLNHAQTYLDIRSMHLSLTYAKLPNLNPPNTNITCVQTPPAATDLRNHTQENNKEMPKRLRSLMTMRRSCVHMWTPPRTAVT